MFVYIARQFVVNKRTMLEGWHILEEHIQTSLSTLTRVLNDLDELPGQQDDYHHRDWNPRSISISGCIHVTFKHEEECFLFFLAVGFVPRFMSMRAVSIRSLPQAKSSVECRHQTSWAVGWPTRFITFLFIFKQAIMKEEG